MPGAKSKVVYGRFPTHIRHGGAPLNPKLSFVDRLPPTPVPTSSSTLDSLHRLTFYEF